MTRWQRIRCWWGFHDDELCIENHRICLRCVTCGNKTEGW